LITMLENQENNQENQAVELTVDEKLAQAEMSIQLLAVTRVKPLLDILGLPTRFYGYIENEWGSQDLVTVRLELEKLNQLLTEAEQETNALREQLRSHTRRVTEVEDYLDENWEDIDEEVREKLCDLFGIDPRVTKSVTVTITGTIDISAPRGYDWDNIGEDLNYDLDIHLENSDLEQDGYGWSGDDFTAEAD
jgi:hypothetical protein